MTAPENWENFERIFNHALVLEGEAARLEYIAAQAEGDAELLADILQLLENDRQQCFLDAPVAELGTRILAEAEDEDLIGREDFGNYHLLKILGRGGMGIVFLAHDTRLNRRIALKILPKTLGNHRETLTRFRQEARAASNVAHPSVAHIYDFGEFENRYYLAMEYVRGRTLRELIKDKLLDENRALDFAVQIASALQAAHRSGIVHRDIKPENVIVTDDNLVKVLDFGLAKIEPEARADSLVTTMETVPGLIMGTTAYMSPEQVRGAAVDYTSDLWSLGVILYETLYGKRPFAGETPSDIRAAILRDEPSYHNAAPPLEKIFRKTLHKEKSGRYETVAELIVDLEKLKTLAAASNLKKNPSEKKSRRILPAVNASRSPLFFGGLLFLLLLLAGIFYFLPQKSKNVLRVTQINRLTNDGKAKNTTVSADGELLAYSIEELGGRGIYLLTRNSRTNEFERQAKPLVAPSKNIISQLAFSPDKNFLYYKMREPDKSVGSFYRIAATGDGGAASERILDNVQGAPSFSPDGKQFVFFRLSLDNSHEEVLIADAASGRAERVLYRRVRPDFIPDTAQPVWSPDGKTILIAGGTYAQAAESYNVYAVQLSDGTAQPILKNFWGEIWATCWIENGAAFVFAGHQEKLADNNQLWRASFPEGEITRLTNDYYDYYTVFAAQPKENQTEILSLILQRTAQIYRADLNNAAASAVSLTAEGDSGYGISVGADGRIFYGSTKAGNPDIWTMAADGGGQRQLTFDDKLDSQPFAAKNGAFVFFGSYRSGLESLWRMKSDGGEQTLVTPNIRRDSLAVTPDGKTIYYRSSAKEAEAVWRVSADGGETEKIAAGNYKSVAVSPDGKLLAATVQTENEEDNKLAILSIENPSAPRRIFKLAEGAEPLEKIRFAPDGKSIAYIVVQKGVGNLWAQPIDGEMPPTPLTDFKSLRLYSFDFTRDGKHFYCSRGELNSHVVRLTLEKAY